jgi:hypothetical protein
MAAERAATKVHLLRQAKGVCNTLANIHSPEQALCLNFFSAEKILTRLIIQRRHNQLQLNKTVAKIQFEIGRHRR